MRELQNVIERAVIVSKGNRLQLDLTDSPGNGQPAKRVQGSPEPARILTETEMRALERHNIEEALKQCSGRIYGPQGAAYLLGLPPTTLTARIKKMGIRKNRER